MENIKNPKIHSVVVLAETGQPVMITDGEYEVDGRISNFWSWRPLSEDGTLQPEEHGYGNFLKYEGSLKLKRTYRELNANRLNLMGFERIGHDEDKNDVYVINPDSDFWLIDTGSGFKLQGTNTSIRTMGQLYLLYAAVTGAKLKGFDLFIRAAFLNSFDCYTDEDSEAITEDGALELIEDLLNI